MSRRTTKLAIARLPNRDFAEGLTTAELGPPDYDEMCVQHAAYVAALEGLGIEVRVLPPLEGFPDAHFVEDTAVVVEEVAVLTRPGAPSRRGEVGSIEEALAGLRLLARVEGEGTVDGGDVLVVGREAFVGLSERTNRAGAEALGGVLARHGYRTTAVPVGSGLHLKSSVNALPGGRLLLTRAFAELPAFRSFERIVVDDEEAYACNVVALGESVLLPAGYPRTGERLAALNLSIVELETSETQKMDGGLTCLSLRLGAT